ncbi:SUMF1/EgtB/PvdO family nonheme iron enzyme [Pelagicoccus sp. NFK12]|uniref:SUMF1/EgtB/PvdO family nonheme iron enzyme n=1 Tax=Pelagicoccus enzymogenes TaxID=2773457 RepID=A0A927F9S7_9BACT|nr:SUMF1/EgtB/PvdO family nonheme iron enzyme [Pelagicoccus enzymogenes]MBD5779795.1 SUMF1/EgtB/PvdO family nonheme iron enzyme [Pelagicoccus enzymogenes]
MLGELKVKSEIATLQVRDAPQNVEGWDLQMKGFNASSYVAPGGTIKVSKADVFNGSDIGKDYGDISYNLVLKNSSGSTVWSRSGALAGGVDAGQTRFFSSQVSNFPAPESEGVYTVEMQLLPSKDEDDSNNSASATVLVTSDDDLESSRVFPDENWDVVFRSDDPSTYTYNFNGKTFSIYDLDSSGVGLRRGSDGRQLSGKAGEYDCSYSECIYINSLWIVASNTVEAEVGFAKYEYGLIRFVGGNELIIPKGETGTLVIEARPVREYFDSSSIEIFGNDEVEDWEGGSRRSNSNRRIEIDFDIPNNETAGTRTANVFLDMNGKRVLESFRIRVLEDPPLITSVTPLVVSTGTVVTVDGNDFSSAGKLSLDGVELETLSWSSSTITFVVPSDAATGRLEVLANGLASNSVLLTVENVAVFSLLNDDGAVSSGEHEFGEIELGDSSSEKIFRLKNIGSSLMLLSGFSSPSEIGYSIESFGGEVLSNGQVSVAVGDYVRLRMTYTPNGVGSDSHTLTFGTNDSLNADVELNFSGTGVDTVAPNLEIVSPESSPFETLVSTLDILATYSDAAPITIRYSVDGGSFTEISGSQGILKIEGIELDVGSNQIVVEAEDGSGNRTTRSIEAVYTEPYFLNLSSSSETGGRVYGDGIYAPGTAVMVNASASEGYEFESWYENDQFVSSENSFSFLLSSDRSLEGVFSLNGTVPRNPVANAGADTVATDSDGDCYVSVDLDGSASVDPDDDIVSWTWLWSEAGEIKSVDGETAIAAMLIGPAEYELEEESGSNTVTLEVVDSNGNSSTDTIVVSFRHGVAESPVIEAEREGFPVSTTVTISHPSDSAVIYYTVDGYPPEADGILYEGPFEVSETMLVQAVAYVDCFVPSFASKSLTKRDDYLRLDVDHFEVGSDSQELEIEVESNFDWEVTADYDWITLNTPSGSGDGTLSISIEENGKLGPRKAEVTVSGAIIEILQSGVVESGYITEERFIFLESEEATDGGFVLDELEAWSAESLSPWLTVLSSEDSGIDGVRFEVEVNSSGELRIGQIEVNGEIYSVVQGQYGEFGFAYGPNEWGQLTGDGRTSTISEPVKVLDGVKRAYNSRGSTIALKSNGELWGISSEGFSPEGEFSSVQNEWILLRSSVRNIAGTETSYSSGSDRQFYFITDSDELYSISGNVFSYIDNDVRSVHPAWQGYYYIKNDNSLYGVDERNQSGKLGVGDRDPRLSPVFIASDVVDADLASYYGAFVKVDGTLWASGAGWSGVFPQELGWQDNFTPVQIGEGVVGVEGLGFQMLVKKADGGLYVFGNRNELFADLDQSQSRHSFDEAQLLAENVEEFRTVKFYADKLIYTPNQQSPVLLYENYNAGTTGTGELYVNGGETVYLSDDVIFASVNEYVGLFVKDDNSLWASGRIQGSIATELEPPEGGKYPASIDISNLADVVSAGRTNFFLEETGELSIAGLSADFLGEDQPLSLERAGIAQDVEEVAILGNGVGYRKSDGSVWLHGIASGTLALQDPTVPVKVAESAISMSGSANAIYWVSQDGKLFAMGEDSQGQLGETSGGGLSNPLSISSYFSDGEEFERVYQVDNEVKVVNALGSTVFYQKNDGALWSFGSNRRGLLGTDSSEQESPTPYMVAPFVDGLVRIQSGSNYFYLRDGELYAWGTNDRGELKTGAEGDLASPVQVADGISNMRGSYLNAIGELRRSVANKTTVSSQVTQFYSGTFGSPLFFETRSPVVLPSNGIEVDYQAKTDLLYSFRSYAPWVAFSSVPWIIIGEESHERVDAELTIAVLQNPTAQSRRGTVSIGGQILEVTQAASPAVLDWGEDQSVTLGAGASMGLEVLNDINASYRWFKDGVELSGDGESKLTVGSAESADAGEYGLVVSEGAGSIRQTELYSGRDYVLQLRSDGSLWGTGRFGDRENRARYALLAEGVRFVSAGSSAALYITEDDVLWGIGSFSPAAAGGAEIDEEQQAYRIADEVQFAEAGVDRTFYVKTDGTAWAMGQNKSGELGVGSEDDEVSTPTQLALSLKAISADALNATLFLTNSGELWGAGESTSGILGDSVEADQLSPVFIASGVKSVEALWREMAYFVDSSSVLYRLDSDSIVNTEIGNVKDISAGESHLLILKDDDSLWGMGESSVGQLGLKSIGTVDSPIFIAEDVDRFTAGGYFSVFVNRDAAIWVSGDNRGGQHGDAVPPYYYEPVETPVGFEQASFGSGHGLYIDGDGVLWSSGRNQTGQLGMGSEQAATTPSPIADNVISVAAALDQSFFIDSDARLRAMGLNSRGRLGDGTTVNRTSPVVIAEDAAELYPSDSNLYFVKTDGTLWGSGRSSQGQLGTGEDTFEQSPVQIAESVVSVASGLAHLLYVKDDGTLWGLGDGRYGQLTAEAEERQQTPLFIADGVSQVAASRWNSAYIKTDGSLWTFGRNQYGELGQGTEDMVPVPVRIAENVEQVAMTYWHTFFVTSDGVLFGAGRNSFGELGNYDSEIHSTPVLVDNRVATISAGNSSISYLTNSGELKLLVPDSEGEVNKYSVVADDIVAHKTEGPSGFARRLDGRSLVFGSDNYGQLGLGRSAERDTFEKVGWNYSATYNLTVNEIPPYLYLGSSEVTHVGLAIEGTLEILTNQTWSAASDSDWISIIGDAAGSGNHTLRYELEANLSGEARVGLVSVGAETLTITQNASPGGFYSSQLIPLSNIRLSTVENRVDLWLSADGSTGRVFVVCGEGDRNNAVVYSASLDGEKRIAVKLPNGSRTYLTLSNEGNITGNLPCIGDFVLGREPSGEAAAFAGVFEVGTGGSSSATILVKPSGEVLVVASDESGDVFVDEANVSESGEISTAVPGSKTLVMTIVENEKSFSGQVQEEGASEVVNFSGIDLEAGENDAFSEWLDIYVGVERPEPVVRWTRLGDIDRDGHTNQFEYIGRFNPVDFDSRLHTSVMPGEVTKLEVGPIKDGVSYSLESSVDFIEWNAVSILEASTSDSGLLLLTVTTPTQPVFYRIVLSRDTSLGMNEFTLIPAGSYSMGSPAEEPGRDASRETLHDVTLTHSFYMSATETTAETWTSVRSWAATNGYDDLSNGKAGSFEGASMSHPITEVSWWDAVKWCNARSEMNGFEPVYYTSDTFEPEAVLRSGTGSIFAKWNADGYRLPTEAEWEYACRAGTTTAFYSGAIANTGVDPVDPNLDAVGWFGGNSGDRTSEVAKKQPNEWGLYDMHGNVLEWCWDRSGNPSSDPVIDPVGPDDGGVRIERGGSWVDDAVDCRAAVRYGEIPDNGYDDLGFRVVRTVVIETPDVPNL